MPMKFDPNDRDDVYDLLRKLEACPSGRSWFRARAGTPAEIWAGADDASFVIWLLEQLLRDEELSWDTPGPFVRRLMALCVEHVPYLVERPVAFGSEVDPESLPANVEIVVGDFTDGNLYGLPEDLVMASNLSTEESHAKFAALVREMYPYQAVADLMVRWVEENTTSSSDREPNCKYPAELFWLSHSLL